MLQAIAGTAGELLAAVLNARQSVKVKQCPGS
jgi:hypothetical protein